MTWRMPLDKYKIGSKFGVIDEWHKAPGHRGQDYYGFPAGTPLKAVNDGTIVINKWSGVLGWVIVLKINDKCYFGYCHMRIQSKLKVGTKVKSGDVIGQAGTTGSASSGVHLHLTGSKDPEGVFYGAQFDPHKFLTEKIKKEKESIEATTETQNPPKTA